MVTARRVWQCSMIYDNKFNTANLTLPFPKALFPLLPFPRCSTLFRWLVWFSVLSRGCFPSSPWSLLLSFFLLLLHQICDIKLTYVTCILQRAILAAREWNIFHSLPLLCSLLYPITLHSLTTSAHLPSSRDCLCHSCDPRSANQDTDSFPPERKEKRKRKERGRETRKRFGTEWRRDACSPRLKGK
jgi:hypothetical protein